MRAGSASRFEGCQCAEPSSIGYQPDILQGWIWQTNVAKLRDSAGRVALIIFVGIIIAVVLMLLLVVMMLLAGVAGFAGQLLGQKTA